MIIPPELSHLHMLDPATADLTRNQRAKLRVSPADWLVATPRRFGDAPKYVSEAVAKVGGHVWWVGVRPTFAVYAITAGRRE